MAHQANPEVFLDLEDGLTASLLEPWTPVGDEITDEVVSLVDDGQFNDAIDRTTGLDYTPLITKTDGALITFGIAAMILGASRARNTRAATFIEKDPLPPQLGQSVAATQDTLSTSFGTQQQKTAQNLINQWGAASTVPAVRAGKVDVVLHPNKTQPEILGRKSTLDRTFSTQYRSALAVNTLKNVGLASSLHTSRMFQWGFLSEAQRINLQFYEVDEVLDSLTCPVCRRMNGTVFPIGPAKQRLQNLLEQGSIEAGNATLLAPWPRQDKQSVARLTRMGSDELLQSGYGTPPYHPFCRGILKQTSKVFEIAGPGRTSPLISALAAGFLAAILPNREESQ